MKNFYDGYVYTRNPFTGENKLYGKITDEFNINNENYLEEDFENSFKNKIFNKYDEFYDMCKVIEKHWKEMMYINFTIINDEIYILSCEYVKRSFKANQKITCDILEELKDENKFNGKILSL